MLTCPRCASPRTRRTRRIGIYEGTIQRWKKAAPFRCRDCGYRFAAPWATAAGKPRSRRSIAAYLGLPRGHGSSVAIILGLAITGFVIALIVLGIILDMYDVGGAFTGFLNWLTTGGNVE